MQPISSKDLNKERQERVEAAFGVTPDNLVEPPMPSAEESECPETSRPRPSGSSGVSLEALLEANGLTQYAQALQGHTPEGLRQLSEDDLGDLCIEADMGKDAFRTLQAALGRKSPKRRSSALRTCDEQLQANIDLFKQEFLRSQSNESNHLRPAPPQVTLETPFGKKDDVTFQVSEEHENHSSAGPLAYIQTFICLCSGTRPTRHPGGSDFAADVPNWEVGPALPSAAPS